MINPSGQGIGGVEGAVNDSRVSDGCAVQTLEIATVKGEDNPTGPSRIAQHPRVVPACLAGFLDGQDIMSQGT
jgi:hypothetical protein